MSSASSAVTYTSVYTDSEPGRVFWGADEEIPDGGVPRVIVYGYDGLPMQPVDPPSPDYVPGPEHPPSPIEIPYVPEPEYPEYLVPSEDEAPMEDQPLPADASPVALSPGYVPDSDPEEDPEEDSEEEHADYPADGGDGDDEPSGDDSDDDTDDDDEEPFEDEEDDEEEEEHLAPANSSAIPVVDPVPSAGDTEAFETDESAPTPRPPQIRIPFAQTRLRRARKTVRPEPPMSASMEARIAEHAAAPTPPLPVASSPLPLPSPLTTSPTDAGAPLGYRAAGIRMRAAAVIIDHEVHLKSVFELLKKERLFAKFYKYEFWLQEVHFLWHVVNSNSIHVDPSKIEVVKIGKYLRRHPRYDHLWDCAPILSLPDGPDDFLVFCDASNQGFGCALMQRGKLFSDCDCEIRYHSGKANVVANALSRKERVKPRRVRAMSMTIQSSVMDKILGPQSEACKVENAPVEMLRGLDQQM
ncbi:hypothetical protein Tco_1335762, partial [Tanacetum coccineum]